MKRFFIASLAILLCMNSFADNRDEKEMLRIAKESLKTSSLSKTLRVSADVDNGIEMMKDNEQFAVYGVKGCGFVVVSRSNSFPAVIGRSDNDYDSTAVSPELKWWMESISKSMAYREANNLGSTSINIPTTVEPFLTTRWSQESPYNLLCPKVESTRAYTGCVATAMSQIMKYYSYPTQSKGTGFYIIDDDTTKVTLNSTFNWEEMKDTYSNSSAMTVENMAVAQLMYDTGVGAKMIYSEDGSSAYNLYAAASFVNNFSYNPYSLRYEQKEYYSDEEWAEMIYNELKNRRPIQYGGLDKDSGGGHAFVFHGINSDGLVYVNWGWNGSCDGWYDIFDLAPPISAGSTNDIEFSEHNDMIIGIDPQSPTSGNGYSLWGTDGEYSITKSNGNIVLKVISFYNITYKTFTGKLGIIFENTSTGNITSYIIIGSEDKDKTIEPLTGYNLINKSLTIKEVSVLPAGTYNVFFGSKDKDETNWTPVRDPVSHSSHLYTMTVSDNKVLNLTGIDNVEETTKDSNGIVRIYNMDGTLVDTISSKSYNESSIQGKGFFIVNEGNSVKKIYKK